MTSRANFYCFKAIAVLMAMVLALSVVGLSDAEAKKGKSKRDSVKGKIFVANAGDSADITFNASGLKNGSAPDAAKGSFSIRISNGQFLDGQITCLRAVDDKASFLVRADNTNIPSEGRFLEIAVLDSGEGQGRGDKISFGGFGDSEQCADPTEEDLDNGLVAVEGNIVVKDRGGAA